MAVRVWNPGNPQWVREDRVLEKVEAIITKLHIEPKLCSKKRIRSKTRKIAQRRDEINALLTNHDQADDNFIDTLVNFANNTHQAFTGSTTQRKRRILNFVFSNFELKGTTLCFTLKKPFDEFIKCRTIGEWCAKCSGYPH